MAEVNEPKKEGGKPDIRAGAKIDTKVDVAVAAVNPFLPTVDPAEKNWEFITLRTPLVPGGVLRIERPGFAAETTLRYDLRQIARRQNVNPEDMDGNTYDTYYVAALCAKHATEPAEFDYLSLNPKSRKQMEGLQRVQLEVLLWMSFFRDDEVDEGVS